MCIRDRYNTPTHVIGHCKAVTLVAMTIGKELNEKGYNLDIELIQGAGLAHDAVSYTHLIGQYVYSYDNEDFVDVVTKKLLSKGITISSAESCTGGLFAGRLTDVPGISEIFERSIVTYSNRAKIEELGVSPTTLEKYGAVSPETAKEMVQGLRKKTGSRLCVSVTGVAGPGGGTAEKPVGLMYIGCIFDGDITVKLSLIHI